MTEYDEIDEPQKSAEYLELIDSAERYFNPWQVRADHIDRLYSDSEHLSRRKVDREFNLFWSNIQTMSPQIYARPPVPVVTPKFKDRRPVYRTASEFLERNCIVSFDLDDIDETMRQLRDDLSIVGRGAAWVRYVKADGDDCIHYEHVFRHDFVHDPARCWKDVSWVARRGWLTRKEMKARFGADIANNADYQSAPSENREVYTVATDHREKCGVWEMWHKPTKKVVWVAEGIDDVLDMQDPYLSIYGFFPCPEPVYSTVQRGTLIPVPDVVYYKDQLDEINDLTRRIHALGRSLQVKGFYQSGGDIGAAIDAAINMMDDAKVMIPVSSTAGLGGGSDPIVWMPIDQISQTLVAAVELRRQLIDDVYQTIGMADIQRGATEAEETFGAQRIKQQNGASRLRDKQHALVRIGRDLVRIGAQVMIDNYSEKTMVDASQMEMPTDAETKKLVKELEKQAKEQLKELEDQAAEAVEQMQMQAMQALQSGEQPDPQMMQQAQMQAQQQFQEQQQAILDAYGQRIKDASEAVTIDQVMDLLRDERIMPFVLDIETDSTIYPDEQAEKASRMEFMGALSQVIPMMQTAAMMGPEAVSFAGGVVKFALAPYRVGRELEGLIDDMVDSAPELAQAQQDEGNADGQQELIAAQNKLADAEMAKAQAQMAKVEADAQLKQVELQGKMQELQLKAEKDQAQYQLDTGKLQLQMSKQEQEFTAKMADMEAKTNLMQAQTAEILSKIGLDVRKQDLEEYRVAQDTQQRQVDNALRVASDAREDRNVEVVEDGIVE